MTWNGWAVTLGGVTFVTCDAQTQADWDELGCQPTEVLDALTDMPAGLDLPSLRTSDVTYFQRDGVKHFADYYEPRIVTLVGTLGPVSVDDCVDGDCSTVRQQLQDAVQAFKRTCCDTEMVVWPDCYTPDFTDGINVYPDGTFDVDTDGWTGDGATVARVTSPVHTGAGALEVTWGTDDATIERASGPVLNVTAGERYRVSGWVFAATGEPLPQIGVTDSLDTNPVLSDPAGAADDSWYQLSVDYTVPDSGELIPFITSSEPTTAGDVSVLDDVTAELYADVNRALNGPFGIVGRPREFKYRWAFRDDQIVDFTARFDAVDQRMYVLDECGTPGYQECVEISPGSVRYSRCYDPTDGRCYTGQGRCYPNLVEGGSSVLPEVVAVGGTERVFPTITIYPGLNRPEIENTTTGEYVAYDGDVTDLPVTINTEDGTAFDADGNSLTHLLRGSLYLSMDPGNYEWRLLSADDPDETDLGYVSVCWRDTVVNA